MRRNSRSFKLKYDKDIIKGLIAKIQDFAIIITISY